MLERNKRSEVLATIAIMIGIIIALVFCGVTAIKNRNTNSINTDNKECKFVAVQTYENYEVVYNEANLVMYIIGENGDATVMVDDDDEPMIWRGRY